MNAEAEDVIYRIFPSKVNQPLHHRIVPLSSPILPHSDRVGSYHASIVPLLIYFIQGATDAHQVNLIAVIALPSVTCGRVHRFDSSPSTQLLQLNHGAR